VRRFFVVAGLAATAVVLVAGTGVSAATKDTPAAKHVLLLSVDGLHQSDLEWYVSEHPSSALAKLVHRASSSRMRRRRSHRIHFRGWWRR